MERDATVFVAGGDTLVGAAIRRALGRSGYGRVLGGAGSEPDLRDAGAVERFFVWERPAYVFVAAGRSGGIHANQREPASLMLDNLRVACHVLDAAHRHRVRKLLYLGSSCVYPKEAPQPMPVESLMSGPLESTSRAYATAKLAGMELCEAYRVECGCNFMAGIPADVYGPGDDFSPERAHVLPALLRRMVEAAEGGMPEVEVWGSGQPRRELLFVDDLAEACLFVMMRREKGGPINLGGGTVTSIRELATIVAELVGYRGMIRFDASRPDGMPLKALDWGELASLGWRPRTDLRKGLAATYAWFLEHSRGASLAAGWR